MVYEVWVQKWQLFLWFSLLTFQWKPHYIKEVCCYLQYVKNVQKEQNRSHNIFFLHGGVINMQFRFIPLWLWRGGKEHKRNTVIYRFMTNERKTWRRERRNRRWPLNCFDKYECWNVADEERWSCFWGSWWPNGSLRHLMLLFPWIYDTPVCLKRSHMIQEGESRSSHLFCVKSRWLKYWFYSYLNYSVWAGSRGDSQVWWKVCSWLFTIQQVNCHQFL